MWPWYKWFPNPSTVVRANLQLVDADGQQPSAL